jgi:hypothetical protein
MATFTASEWTSQPKAVHVGVLSKSAVAEIAVTGTASSVIKLVKIPNGAVITDFTWYTADAAADQTYKLGLRLPISDTVTVTESALSGDLSSTGGQTHRGGIKLPYKVSFTNNAIQQWAWIEAVAKIAISASANHRFTVFYTMDGS